MFLEVFFVVPEAYTKIHNTYSHCKHREVLGKGNTKSGTGPRTCLGPMSKEVVVVSEKLRKKVLILVKGTVSRPKNQVNCQDVKSISSIQQICCRHTYKKTEIRENYFLTLYFHVNVVTTN